ncbi:hypothetical protein KHA80_16300 [Anaerobacillus sp. HL2]|nr:hypothetical protein KHA80_16300 [Anaerobacillus sp. HL2]
MKTNVKMVEKKHLFSYSQDLIAISSAYKGEIQLLISEGNYEASKKIEEYKQYFGEDYYVGIQDYPVEEKQINLHLVKLSKKGNIKLVATIK